MTIWLVGIKPNHPTAEALLPLGGRYTAADRLRVILRMTVEEFLTTFPNRINVYDKKRGAEVFEKVHGTIFVFGRDAWVCLGLPKTTSFWETYTIGEDTFHLLPHPSGRNVMYNSSHQRNKLRRRICSKRRSRMSSRTSITPSATPPGATP